MTDTCHEKASLYTWRAIYWVIAAVPKYFELGGAGKPVGRRVELCGGFPRGVPALENGAPQDRPWRSVRLSNFRECRGGGRIYPGPRRPVLFLVQTWFRCSTRAAGLACFRNVLVWVCHLQVSDVRCKRRTIADMGPSRGPATRQRRIVPARRP